MGRYFENKDFKLIESAASLVEAGLVKIYCPDGIDSQSWYNKNIHPADRVRTHIAYENVILHDVIDCAIRETGKPNVGVAGCSFGGYHAVNIAFRRPDKIGYVFSMSGAFDIKQFLNGYYDDNCYFNNPPDYLVNLNDPRYIENMQQMGIILGAGDNDMCLEENKRLSEILHQKKIQHWLDLRLGAGHDWPWWRQMFPEYLTRIKQ